MIVSDPLGDALGLTDWPESVYMAQDAKGQRHGLFRRDGVIGLAVFRTEEAAREFVTIWRDGLRGCNVLSPIPFDDARAVALSKPGSVRCIYLMDNAHTPCAVHWVR